MSSDRWQAAYAPPAPHSCQHDLPTCKMTLLHPILVFVHAPSSLSFVTLPVCLPSSSSSNFNKNQSVYLWAWSPKEAVVIIRKVLNARCRALRVACRAQSCTFSPCNERGQVMQLNALPFAFHVHPCHSQGPLHCPPAFRRHFHSCASHSHGFSYRDYEPLNLASRQALLFSTKNLIRKTNWITYLPRLKTCLGYLLIGIEPHSCSRPSHGLSRSFQA